MLVVQHLVSGSVSLGAGADSVSYGPGGGVASVSSATSHSSLLLRTWLEQLHFPPQLHPVVMELVAQLALSTDKIAEATQPKPRRKRLDGDEPTVSEIHKATTRQQTMSDTQTLAHKTRPSRSGPRSLAHILPFWLSFLCAFFYLRTG